MDGLHNGNPRNTHLCFKASKGFKFALGMMIWSSKDSITTKDLSTVSNSAGSFLKGPVLCVVRPGKITKKRAAFICREWGEDDFFLGGRDVCFFLGKILGS